MALLGDIFGVGGVASLAGKVVDIVKGRVPDVNAQAQIAAEVEKTVLEHEFQLIAGQMEINKVEASHGSLFVAGARPAVIWVGVVSLALATWPKALALTVFWGIQAYHVSPGASLPAFPDLGTTDVIALMGSLLGIAGMRTAEKIKGVATMTTRQPK